MAAFTGIVPSLSKQALKVRKFNNGHWLFPEQLGIGVGFIYVIRDNYLRRCYLGKKQFFGMGKLNRGEESDWRHYESSSNILKAHFKERPRHEFEFIAIEQYRTKGTLAYSETWSLCIVEAPTTKDWYNVLIPKVTWDTIKESITKRHKERLQKVLDWASFSDVL
jgi:hypothetical protein